jgi:hypothetical protein
MPGAAKRFCVIIYFSACVTALSAREVKITVQDADLLIPLEGAVIHAWDGLEYNCDENGELVLEVPEGRQVLIQALYPGYETGRLLVTREDSEFTLPLRLGGVMEGRELVIEARSPLSSETKSGRSVAISGEALERSAQIGLVEDVMTAVKLLPGVGYSGIFNALPSIRGGDPGDLTAVLDGFYIESPYHWGGGFSIFDPHMVGSARLSHGIFSTRYGHTISGLLEITSKKPDPRQAELELGLSTSAVNLNLSFPFNEKGGLMAMGKATYWDPFVWAVKQISKVTDNETIDMINAVTTAPYIRSAEITTNYRFNTDLEWTNAIFIGADGVGADYLNENNDADIKSKSRMVFDWDNLQGFFISGLGFNPRNDMMLKAAAGAGFTRMLINGMIDYDYLDYSDGSLDYSLGPDDLDMAFNGTQTALNVQGRIDYDWSLGRGFLLGAGVQELYSWREAETKGKIFLEGRLDDFPSIAPFIPSEITEIPNLYLHFPTRVENEIINQMVNSSVYTLLEYSSPEGRLGAEAGLRLDHLYFIGKDFTIQTMPVLNPRLNLDFNLFKNRGVFESFDLTAGTGLFSSSNDAIAGISVSAGIDDFTLRPNRSWTSVLGFKTDLLGGWSFNMEGYYKYVFDRSYTYNLVSPGSEAKTVYRFDGDGMVLGFDLQLQKFDSRYWDGWLSYTFTYAKYHESENVSDGTGDVSTVEDSGWYYPYFHRFHNINLALNFKPSRNFNIYTRLGLASGRPKPKVGAIKAYDVLLLDENGAPVTDGDGKPKIIKKYKRSSYYDENSRTTWSIPLDVKFSYFIFKPGSKVTTEIYLAAENLFSLVYSARANTSFNTYTGKEDTGSDSANYEMPIPMVSFGMKWSY